jgi:hypothetical protein
MPERPTRLFKPLVSPPSRPAPYKRREMRMPARAPGLIGMPGFKTQVPCRIEDMSSRGARAAILESSSRIRSSEHLPDDVVLVFTADRMEVQGNIRWRRGNVFGMSFSAQFRKTERLPPR